MSKTAGFLIAIAVLVLPSAIFAYVSPGNPKGYVSDFANVLTETQVASLSVKLDQFARETGNQIAVVTIDSVGNDETIDSYAVKLFSDWKIGDAKSDSGVLILVAIKDRSARIEVGYGNEGDLTDVISSNILKKVMFPKFAVGDYAGGIEASSDAVMAVLKDGTNAENYLDTPKPAGGFVRSLMNEFGAIIFGLVIVFLNTLAVVLGKTKSWWLGGVIGAAIGVIIALIIGFTGAGIGIIVVLSILGLIFDFIVSRRPPGSNGRGGGFWPIIFGSGRSGGFGGGSFGGFGGGMSGGGGASGRR